MFKENDVVVIKDMEYVTEVSFRLIKWNSWTYQPIWDGERVMLAEVYGDKNNVLEIKYLRIPTPREEFLYRLYGPGVYDEV